MQSFKAEGFIEVLPFLIQELKGQSRSHVKSLLSKKQIQVNNRPVSQFNFLLKPGDKVVILGKNDRQEKPSSISLKIIYEDEWLILIDKPSGMLSISTEKEKFQTAYRVLSEHVKQQNPQNRIFVLHRLDRDTSGVMMFAKNQTIQQTMQSNWNELITKRQYHAIVEGKIGPPDGVLTHYLLEGSTGIVHITQNQSKGYLSTTHYRTVASNREHSLIELTLDTGRKNQIRVQFSHEGHPVAGDKKYGATTNPIGRLALHASLLSFIHPVTNKELSFSSHLPQKMQLIFKVV